MTRPGEYLGGKRTHMVVALAFLAVAFSGCVADEPLESAATQHDANAETAVELDEPEEVDPDTLTSSNPLAHADHGEHAAHVEMELMCDLGALAAYNTPEAVRPFLPEGVEPFVSSGIVTSRVHAANGGVLTVLYGGTCLEGATGQDVSLHGIAISIDVDWAGHAGDVAADRTNHWYMVEIGFDGPVLDHMEALGFPAMSIANSIQVSDLELPSMSSANSDTDGGLASFQMAAGYLEYREAAAHVQWYQQDDGRWVRMDSTLYAGSTGFYGETTACSLRADTTAHALFGGDECLIYAPESVAWRGVEQSFHFEYVEDPREADA